ncbi:MAG: tail fiber domain-containing protein [Phycisphaerales bacterium]|nr:tail fiber domain-containing protein [Phycisphaerales bacterium]
MMKRVLSVIGMCGVLAMGAAAQSSTVFTYQGRLESAGSGVSGTADLKFRLYAQSAGGASVGAELVKNSVAVDAGVFSTDLDFGDAAFLPGTARWLEIDVRSPSGSGGFTTLGTRVPVNPTPLAQGLAGATITRAGPASVDQNQYDNQFNGILPLRLDLTPIWQSFTAGRGGTLTQVDLNGYGLVSGTGDKPITVRIRAGVGTGGALLGTGTAMVRQGQSTIIPVSFSGISVVSGETYTIDPTGPIFIMGAQTNIPGAQAGPPDYRIAFRTWVAPEATISLKALRAGLADTARSVDWANIGNVPANVLAAYWQSATGGITYPNRVGIGTASPATSLHIKGEAGMLNLEGQTHAYVQFYPQGTGVGRRAYIGIPGAGSNGFTVANEVSGGTLALIGSNVQIIGNFINNSDARDKHNVRDIDDALSLVERLRGVRFEWNEIDGLPLPKGEQVGFLAQEVERVAPELVATGSNGHKGVSYVSIVPLLTEAIKQQKARFDAEITKRDAEAAAKQREIDDLKARLERLERAMNVAR